MIKTTQKLYEINESKIGKDGQFKANIRQQCDKKRLDVLSCILKLKEGNKKAFYFFTKEKLWY